MRYGGSKLKKLEKCDFYAILTRNINGELLKKLLKAVTQNLKSFSNPPSCLTPNILCNASYFSVNPPSKKQSFKI